jgi:hypothetical protein
MCRNLAVNAPSAQLSGKFTATKNTFPSGQKEASPGQPRHVKKQRRITLLIEPLPRRIAGRHDRGTM